MRHKKLISAKTSPILWEDLIKSKGRFTTLPLSSTSVSYLLSQQADGLSSEQKLFSKDVYSVFLIAAAEVSEASLVERAKSIMNNAPEPLSFVISTNATSARKMICFFPEGVSKGNVFKLIPPDKWGATVSLGDDMATVHGNDHSLIQNTHIQPEALLGWHNLSLPNTHIEDVLSHHLSDPSFKVLVSDNDGTLVGINKKAPTPQTFAYLRTFLERADSEIHIVTGSSIRALEMYLKFILSLTEAQSEKLTFHCLNGSIQINAKEIFLWDRRCTSPA